MKNEPRGQFVDPANRQGGSPTPEQQSSRRGLFRAAVAVFLLSGGAAAAQGNSPTQLRRYIDQQVGGIEKLKVPARNEDLPKAQLPDGRDASGDPRFKTTAAKRYPRQPIFH